MTIPELAEAMGGLGRARLAWDAYSIGVDPALFHSDGVQLGHDDFESILEGLPSGRRRQRLGHDALARLGQTYPAKLGRLEGGVASLSHVSASSDSTTKLLLKLSDGLEIETVIIPWNGVRSTLCVSSQVGCRQGASVPHVLLALRVPFADIDHSLPLSFLQAASSARRARWACSVP